MKKILLVIGMVTGIIAMANAQTVVKERQKGQIERIEHGVENGELNRAEAKRLKAGQRDIQRNKRRATADGIVTRREVKHIKRDQRRASRDIYRQKNDLQSRD